MSLEKTEGCWWPCPGKTAAVGTVAGGFFTVIYAAVNSQKSGNTSKEDISNFVLGVIGVFVGVCWYLSAVKDARDRQVLQNRLDSLEAGMAGTDMGVIGGWRDRVWSRKNDIQIHRQQLIFRAYHR